MILIKLISKTYEYMLWRRILSKFDIFTSEQLFPIPNINFMKCEPCPPKVIQIEEWKGS